MTGNLTALAIGAVLLLAAGLIWRGPSTWLARRNNPSRDRARWRLREPLFLLRLRTRRKRRRNSRCTVLADALRCPLSADDERVWDDYKKEIR